MRVEYSSVFFIQPKEMRPKRIQVVQTDSDSVCTSISTLPSIDSKLSGVQSSELRERRTQALLRQTVAREEENSGQSRTWALACNIDTYSRSVFPIIFLAFNVAYWVVFPNISPIPQETDFVIHQLNCDIFIFHLLRYILSTHHRCMPACGRSTACTLCAWLGNNTRMLTEALCYIAAI